MQAAKSGNTYSWAECRGRKPRLKLPAVGGGKKTGVYRESNLPLTSLTQIQDQALAVILAHHQGIWSGEAEQYLLAHAEAISHD